MDLQQLQDHQEFTKEQILQSQNMLEGLRSELAEENRKLDSKKNEQVRLGDAVKMKYKKSYLDSVAKMTTSMLDQ